MMLLPCLLVTVTFLLALAPPGQADLPQHNDCPEYGCTPSGTFSTPLNISRQNATVAWVTDVQQLIHRFPKGQGCVGIRDSLVCQSNGPLIEDSGYISLDPNTGSVRWHDNTLWFPTLPVLLPDGSIIGADGMKWARYTKDGAVGPVINLLPNIFPLLFGMQQISTDKVLMISTDGILVVMEMDGHPVAELALNRIVERYNGTFIPIAPVVVNGNRFYVLAQFILSQSVEPTDLAEQCLFAIDYHNAMVDKLQVVWQYSFQRESSPRAQVPRTDEQTDMRLRYRPWKHHAHRWESTGISSAPGPIQAERYFQIMFDNTTQTIFVVLSPAGNIGVRSFWGIRDTGTGAERVFVQMNITVTGMTAFEGALRKVSRNRSEVKGERAFAGSQLWVVTNANKLCAYTKTGILDKSFDLNSIFNTKVRITTPLMGYRGRIADEDVLVFGIEILASTEGFRTIASSHGVAEDNKFYVVAIDTPENSNSGAGFIMWMVPTPGGGQAKGQIIGMSASGSRTKDQLIVFSQIADQVGTFFAIR